jgi:hypothetical protein
MLGNPIELTFVVSEGQLDFNALPAFKQRKLVRAITQDLSKCAPASQHGDLKITGMDTMSFNPIDDEHYNIFMACIPRTKVIAKLFSKEYKLRSVA